MENVDLLGERELIIDSYAVNDYIKFLHLVTVTWVCHVGVPQIICCFLLLDEDVPLLKNVPNIVGKEAVNLVIDYIDETHFCQTLKDNLIVAEIGHLEDCLSNSKRSSFCSLEVNSVKQGVGRRILLVSTNDHVCIVIYTYSGLASAECNCPDHIFSD